jgi:hypothetical protein
MHCKSLLNCILIPFFLIGSSACAQHSVFEGSVIDSKSKEPLPFVNVLVQGTTQGTTTGIDGRFRIETLDRAALVFSYVGYESQTIAVSSVGGQMPVIELKESAQILKAVEIVAGENPAFKIIRKAIANRSLHDPENLESFSYKAYHKFYATTEGAFDSPADTTRMSRFFKNNHLFMNESFTERKFVKPNSDKEIVIGNRMSGVKDPFFAILATSFQPFSFYKNHISLVDKNYINPISPGSLERYDFDLADTVLREADTTYIISFQPLRGKIFEGLKGLLYISTNGYALEHVLAEPADPQLLTSIRIQQKYSYAQGHWFPEQLNTEFVLQEYKIANHTVKYVQRSFLSEVQINPSISKKEFGLLNIEFSSLANRQKENFWSTVRMDSLSKKEKNTYALYDSVSPRQLATLNSIVKIAEAFAVGKFTVGSFYIPIESILRVNKYEAYRFGLGLQTGERISRRMVLDSYVAYGVKDKAVKYGGGIQLNLYPRKELFLKFSYASDVLEPGNPEFIKSPVTATGGQLLRNLLASRMDSIELMKVVLNMRPLKFTQLQFFIQQQKHHPVYNYSYQLTDLSTLTHFAVAEIGMQWRYAFREKYAQMGPTTIVTNFAFPQVNFAISRALSSVLDGKFDFTKVELKIDYQFLVRGLGKTNLQLASGYLDGDAPYPYLFNGKGSNYSTSFFNSVVVPNYFQSMGVYEFVNDRYTYLFLTHHFGRIVGTRTKHFRPELSISQNTGVGSLRENSAHGGVDLMSLEKGFFEGGMTLSNIFRFRYMNVAYVGFGAGVFYRYGPNALPNESDNLVLKLSFTFSL